MAGLIVYCAAAAIAASCTNAWFSPANPPATEALALALGLTLALVEEGMAESELCGVSDEDDGAALEDSVLELGVAELLDVALEDGVHVDDGVELVVGGGVDEEGEDL